MPAAAMPKSAAPSTSSSVFSFMLRQGLRRGVPPVVVLSSRSSASARAFCAAASWALAASSLAFCEKRAPRQKTSEEREERSSGEEWRRGAASGNFGAKP